MTVYETLAKEILNSVGGRDNVNSLTHCITCLLYTSYSHTTIDRQTDFVKLAEAFGGKGLRIKTRHDIEGVMKEALSSKVPCIVDCWIDKDDCVYPIIPPGKSGKDIILYGN